MIRNRLFALVGLALFGLSLLGSPALAQSSQQTGPCGTATATSNAATLNNRCGSITTEALTAPAASEYLLTLTNSAAAATDIVLWSVGNGSNTTGLSTMGPATPAAGSITFKVRHATGVNYNGTLEINYSIVRP